MKHRDLIWSLPPQTQFQKGEWLKLVLEFGVFVTVITLCDGEENNAALVFFVEYLNFIPYLS